jgi:integrase
MARRNANGEGSISKRKDGRWEGAISLSTVSGRTKRIRKYGKTRKEAHGKLMAAVTQAQRGSLIPDRAWKVDDYLDYWLENVVQANRRRTTYSRYEIAVRLHLKSGLGGHPLERLTVPITQAFFNQKLAEGTSVRGVHIMREVLSAALTNAQREELISRNVARLVTLPTYEPDEVKPWSADEASRFLEIAQTSPYHVIFALLMLYGMRRGEVLGLRWQDIDFPAGEIHIRQQVQQVKGVLYQAPLKTKAGKRDLPLLPAARRLLIAQQARQDVSASLVFTSDDGGPVHPQTISRCFIRLSRAYGLRIIRLHDLRHTTNTLLKKLGVPVRDRQLILGHADISTTQTIYEHDDMESRRESLGKFEKLLLSQQELPEDGAYCRQNYRQLAPRGFEKALITSGRGGGIRTPGPRFWRPSGATLQECIASINQACEARRRALILGTVAVIFAVNFPDEHPTSHTEEAA